METDKKNYLKFFLGLLLCLLVRLIPFRAPNIEPILATAMPTSRAYGSLAGFFFGIFSVLLYDFFTRTLGMQTFFTAGAYGVLGLLSAAYFKNREANAANFVRFAVVGTLFFDAFTGLTVGPIFFHQSFFNSLIGQIPFTALHLAGNVAFAYALSPAIYNFFVRKRKHRTTEIITSALIPNLN